jgi:hypothetical protein
MACFCLVSEQSVKVFRYGNLHRKNDATGCCCPDFARGAVPNSRTLAYPSLVRRVILRISESGRRLLLNRWGQGFRGLFLLCAAVVPLLAGCAPEEHLIVPPASQMLGHLPVKQPYVLAQPTIMASMDAGNKQPEILLRYNKNTDPFPPAEALERVPFPVSAETEELVNDPSNPDAPPTMQEVPTAAYWGQVVLQPGTQILVSSIESYSNSHVYRARVLTGPAHNCFILLVVPVGDHTLPNPATLQAEDRTYLTPLNVPTNTARAP